MPKKHLFIAVVTFVFSSAALAEAMDLSGKEQQLIEEWGARAAGIELEHKCHVLAKGLEQKLDRQRAILEQHFVEQFGAQRWLKIMQATASAPNNILWDIQNKSCSDQTLIWLADFLNKSFKQDPKGAESEAVLELIKR